MQNAIERLRVRIPARVDGLLVQTPVNRRYLTGFKSSAGFVLILREDAVFLTDFRYYEAARVAVNNMRVELYTKIADTFADYRKRFGLRGLLVEHDQMRLGELERMQSAFQGVKLCHDHALDDLIADLRMVKSPADVQRIRAAQALTEAAYADILPKIRPGVTEREVALALEYDMRRKGAEGVSFDPIVVSGRNTALPHGVPTPKPIESGDFVTMDIGAMLDGWCSDMTRTVAVHTVSDEQRAVYDTVLRAQTTALNALRAGQSGGQIDKMARTVIEQAGYGDAFGHSTGHGVGMDIHETPNLAPGHQRVLTAGHVVTVEPGIYLAGQFGVRIEDMALVTLTGHENLTTCPKELVIL